MSHTAKKLLEIIFHLLKIKKNLSVVNLKIKIELLFIFVDFSGHPYFLTEIPLNK